MTHCSFGILLSTNGISGQKSDDNDEKHAKALIRRAFHEHDTLCLPISLDDVRKLFPKSTGLGETSPGPEFPNVTSLLFDAANRFQFGH